MICSFGDRIFGKVMIVGLDAIIVKTKLKFLEMFTHITHKFELGSFEVRHSVIPLLKPSLEARTSRRTILYSLRDPTWQTTTTYSQQSHMKTADQQLGKPTLDSEKLDIGLVSAGSNGIEP